MTASNGGPQRVRPRQSLSGRLWLVATLAVLLSEIVVFLPYIAHERSSWLAERVEDSAIAILAGAGSTMDADKRTQLLRLSRVEAIRFTGRSDHVLEIGDVPQLSTTVDLRHESEFSQVHRALEALFSSSGTLVHVVAATPFEPEGTVEVWLREDTLDRILQEFAWQFIGLALLAAAITGGLVYLAVLILLVRPMRRITSSIAAFRADPERTTPLDPDRVTILLNDEVAAAGRELAAMQHELRAALWRNARLAALGTMVAKVSHDLRGILTPALLAAERLQLNPDHRVQRAGDVLTQAVDRATDLVRRTLDYAREGPPPLELAPVKLAPLVTEAAEAARPLGSQTRLRNAVDPAILVQADRNQLFRVLTNLIRNAFEAGARQILVVTEPGNPLITLDISDDGPGLPEAVHAGLFRPFAASTRPGGTGLGLAIARDLMVAHGGNIELLSTGAAGTVFRLSLRCHDGTRSAEAGREPIAPATTADV